MSGDDPRTHPHHDAVAREVRGWFVNSAPEINYVVHEHWYGYQSNREGPIGARLVLTVDDPLRVADAVDEARSESVAQDLTIWVDDRQRAAKLDDALLKIGAESVKATTHLALVGTLNAAAGPASLVLERVTEDNLEEWAITKIRCFDEAESEPDPDRLAAELAVRRGEAALATLQLARIDGEAVGVLGYYAGIDDLVFNLGTRVPFRHRGVAQAVLQRWVTDGQSTERRSYLINADDPGMPQNLYRRMGFVDEVYWYQRYLLRGASAHPSQ